jgi:hypothetical protein
MKPSFGRKAFKDTSTQLFGHTPLHDVPKAQLQHAFGGDLPGYIAF